MTSNADQWKDDPSHSEDTKRLKDVAVFGLGTFAWYAMPDYIRPRSLRFLGKTGLVAGLGYYLLGGEIRRVQEARSDRDAEPVSLLQEAANADEETMTVKVDPDVDADRGQTLDDIKLAATRVLDNMPGAVASQIGAYSAYIAIGVATVATGELLTFRLGERLRKLGLKRAHTAVGAIYGSLAAYLEYHSAFLSKFDPGEDDGDSIAFQQ